MCGALTISIPYVNSCSCPAMGGEEAIYVYLASDAFMLMDSPRVFLPWQGKDTTVSARFCAHLQTEFHLTGRAY